LPGNQTLSVTSKLTKQTLRKPAKPKYISKKKSHKQIWFRTQEVAQLMGRCPYDIAQWCREGLITGAKQIKTRWYVPRAWIESLLTEEDEKE